MKTLQILKITKVYFVIVYIFISTGNKGIMTNINIFITLGEEYIGLTHLKCRKLDFIKNIIIC